MGLWEKHMARIKAINPSAYQLLKSIRARHKFNPLIKCDKLLNNISKCFNAYIIDARDKPILTCLEWIRRSLIVSIHENREKMGYKGPVCPKIQKKLEKIKLHSKHWSATSNGDGEFEVRGGASQFVVDLKARKCSCFK
jgi:hypothetical protein